MALQSAFGNLYNEILNRLKTEVPEIRYVNHDLGQLEQPKPSVSWPCILIDLDEFEFTDVAGNNKQLADGFIVLRIGFQQWSKTSSITPDSVREKGLGYYELEAKIYKALHSWAPQGFGRLLRRKASTEKRDDDVRVRLLVFAVNFEDNDAAPEYETTPRPSLKIKASSGSPE